jgi:YidC/Oxa1 family membrane protein insertase
MESRRFILALSLSLLVFIAYAKFFTPEPSQKPPVSETAKQETAEQKPAPTPVRPESVAGKIQAAAGGRDIVIETDIVKAVVNTAGGVIKRWELRRYREADKTEAGIGALWKKITGEARGRETEKGARERSAPLPVRRVERGKWFPADPYTAR